MILVVGDIHNKFHYLNSIIKGMKPELILCCGDLGYYPRISGAKQLTMVEAYHTKILWCDGNHEDFYSLKQRETDEMYHNIVYMPRGSTYTLEDGRTILFMGGALSIDKHQRTPGYDWFADELISQRDIYNLPDVKVDIVISHTCPDEILKTMQIFYPLKHNDPSTTALSEVYKKYKPSLWYFGHWHKYLKTIFEDTLFIALNCVPFQSERRKWFIRLEK